MRRTLLHPWVRRAVAVVSALLAGTTTVAPSGEPPGGRTLFRSYGPEQGLGDPTISCLAQDGRGLLWIGTETGLVRYDGRTFRRWTRRDGLPGSWVTRILPVAGDKLWLVTTQGLVQFADGRITPARFGPAGTPGKPDRSLVDVDRAGRLWVLRRDAVHRETSEGSLDPLPGRPPGRSSALACSANSEHAFVAIANALYRVNGEGVWTPLGELPIPPEEEIEGMAEDGTGRLWIVSARHLLFRDTGGPVVDASALLPAPPFTEAIPVRSGGWVLVPTNAGLLMLSGERRELVDRAAGLPSLWARTGLVDREGNLWVAGPSLYRRLGRGFLRAFTEEDGLPSSVVWVVRRIGGFLVAGTNDGVAWLDADGWHRVPGSEGLAASAIEEDHAGRVWIAFSNGPPIILRGLQGRPTVKTFASLRPVPRRSGAALPEPLGTPFALLRDGRTMLVGDDGLGLFRADLDAGTIAPEFTRDDAGSRSLVILRVAASGSGVIFAATSEGLLRHDGGGWRLFTPKDGLAYAYVAGVLPEEDGSCWVWYQEPAGMDRVMEETGRLRVVEHLDTATGLASDHVYAVVKTPDGALWVALDRGVDRVRDGRVLHLGRGAGLVGEDCCANGSWCDEDGDVWVGTATGLAHIAMRQEPATPPPPITLFTRVVTGQISHELPVPPRLRLGSRDTTVELRWASPTFVDEGAVRWEVRLAGLDEEWRPLDEPAAQYPRLPAGRYRFEVRARFAGGPPGPTAAVDLEVAELWWRGWPAFLLAGVALMALGAGAVRLRLQAVARRAARLEALVAQRTAELHRANQELANANQALAEASLTDPLTGLRNRRYLSLVIEPEAARVARLYATAGQGQVLPNQDIVVFMIDLDRFKAINDTYGHVVGDDVLRATARALAEMARSSDTVVRWGGEEFLLLAHGTNRGDAAELAERIRRSVAEQELPLPGSAPLRWSCSVGFAALPFDPRWPAWLSWERVVALADAALYLAKEAGRNAWCGIAPGPGLRPELHDEQLRRDVAGLLRTGLLEAKASRQLRG